jgi:NADH-quinone oxidoreductase subunit G
VDLCPVGALLSKDFLHKARAWDLDKAPSICAGCTQGCNAMLETRDGQVLRIQPRPNPDVNRHFMCDEGRGTYRWMNRADRLEAPMVRRDGRLVAVSWDQALDHAADVMRGAKGEWVGLVSPGASCEALDAAMSLLKLNGGTGAFRVREGVEVPLAGVGDLALRRERAPNVYGALEAGFTRDWDGAAALAQRCALVLVLDEALDAPGAPAGALIHIGTVESEHARRHAAVILPCTNVAEEEGSFRNLRGRVQRYEQAKPAPGMARPAAWILAGLRELLGAESPA